MSDARGQVGRETPPPAAPSARPLVAVSSFLARSLAIGVVAGLALFAVGRICTDRFHLTQYFWWIPSLVAGGAAVAGLTLSHLFALAAGRGRGSGRPRTGRRRRIAAWLGTLALAAHAIFVEWHPPGAQDFSPRDQRFRIVYWNYSVAGEKGWERPATNSDPDLFITLAGSCTSSAGTIEWLGENDYFADTCFLVATRAPVVAYAFVNLNIEQGEGIDPRQADFVRKTRDPGRGMILLLDAKQRLGRDIVVWVIDMPSDLSLSREKSGREALDAMLATPPRLWRMKPDHRTRERVVLSDEALERLKHPDVVLGDFNAPRGSASLRHVSLGYPNAFDQAGEGYCATFPREGALWHLDQMFVGPELRAVTYRVIDAPLGSHRPQLADLVRATPPEPTPSAASSSAPASGDRPGPSANDPARPPAGTNP